MTDPRVWKGRGCLKGCTHTHTHTHTPVSYTHLDVYKRQICYLTTLKCWIIYKTCVLLQRLLCTASTWISQDQETFYNSECKLHSHKSISITNLVHVHVHCTYFTPDTRILCTAYRLKIHTVLYTLQRAIHIYINIFIVINYIYHLHMKRSAVND